MMKRMRALDLDYRRPRASPAGWALLAAGVLLLGLLLVVRQQVAGAAAAAVADLERSERILPGVAAAPVSAAESRAQRASQAEMQRLSEQLSLPWERLFANLEAIADDDIALLSLAPDARKQQLRISAEARDLPAMLAFHRRLEHSGDLRDVALVNHEIVDEVPERPVRFNLTATWTIRHAHP
jgi:Tfp pilus assembly protein PilN